MYELRLPNPTVFTSWLFFLLLVGISVCAAVVDFRTMRLPNWLTIPSLLAGFIVHAIFGTLVVTQGSKPEAWWAGTLMGLLFSLCGFVSCFGIFFIMWVLGKCGGGDLKLFSAIGAWLGIEASLFVLSGTILLVLIFIILRGISRAMAPAHLQPAGKPGSRKNAAPMTKEEYDAMRFQRKKIPYGPALVICVALFLLYQLGENMRVPLIPKKAQETVSEGR